MTDAAAIELHINGEGRRVPPGLSLTGLLTHLGLEPGLVIVEHNGFIIRRDRYDEVQVEAGDALELVHFVGGGI